MTKKHKELSDLSTGLTPKHTEGKHAEQFHNVSNDENQRVFYLRANSETLKKAVSTAKKNDNIYSNRKINTREL